MTKSEPNEKPLARKIGFDLLDATSRFDSPLGVKRGSGPVDLALIAFGLRGRRLLRAAYRLLDATEPDAANALFRVMSEYLIVGRWLIKSGEERMRAWAIDDLRERRNTLGEVLGGANLSAIDRTSLNKEIANTENAIRNYGGPKAALSKSAARKAGESPAPSRQAMAQEIGFSFAYSYMYRLLSQADVHATPLAIDSVFDEDNPADPGPRVRPIPRYALQGYDSYSIGAHLLLDIVRPLVERVPELTSKDALDEIERRLQTAAAS